jgi:hypothetical protein
MPRDKVSTYTVGEPPPIRKKVASAASHLILADIEVLGKRKFVHTKVTAGLLGSGRRHGSPFPPSENRSI